MKKILLASAALVLSAGLAHAQAVRITGEGRMGILYDSNGFAAGSGPTDWIQESRLQLNFNVSVEADHGLTFGAYTRARIASGWGGGPGALSADGLGFGGFSSARVWVEANGFRLTFGNVDGAIRGAGASHGYVGGCGIGYVGGISCWDSAGLLGLTQGFDSIYNPASPVHNTSRVRIDYTMGSTRVALSYDRGGNTEFGIRTTFDAFTVALGYSNGNTLMDSVWTISGSYNGGSWSVGAIVASYNGDTNYSLSGTVQLGGGSLYGYVGRVFGDQSYGLNYSYGLGGGASVSIGAERLGSRTVGAVGVVFSF